MPVDRAFTADVVARFLLTCRGATKTRLSEAAQGPGGLSRFMSALKEDKASSSSFSRFEQACLLTAIENFLRSQGVSSKEMAPSLELFEGV